MLAASGCACLYPPADLRNGRAFLAGERVNHDGTAGVAHNGMAKLMRALASPILRGGNVAGAKESVAEK